VLSCAVFCFAGVQVGFGSCMCVYVCLCVFVCVCVCVCVYVCVSVLERL